MNLRYTIKRIRSQKLTFWLRLVSMGIGIASALILFFIARNNLTTDNFYPGKERMFEIFNDFKSPEYSGISSSLEQPVVPAMVAELPQVEAGTVVFFNGPTPYKTENTVVEINTLYADSLFFRVFPRRFLAGDSRQALQRKNTAIITRRLAVRLFGSSANSLNKTLYFNSIRPILITGVIEDWPPNAAFQSDILLSFATLKDENRLYMGWDGGDSFRGYIKTVRHADPRSIEKALPALLREHYDVDAAESRGFFSTYRLIPLTQAPSVENPTKKIFFSILIFIGLLIFGLVCFNSLLLILAGYRKFSREISIQRTLGASEKDMHRLIFNEALLYMLASSAVALLFLILIAPFLEDNFPFRLSTVITSRPFLLLFLPVFLTGFLMIYFFPARWTLRFYRTLHLSRSSFKPLINLRLQQVLLVLQTGISLFLFVFLFFIFKQFSFIRHFDKGYDSGNLVYIGLNNKPLYTRDRLIRDEIRKIPGVLSASLSDDIPVWGLSGNTFSARPDGQHLVVVRNLSVDEYFFSTLKMELEGPGFRGPADRHSVVISRKAAELFDLNDPVGKNIYRGKRAYPVKGIVNNIVSGTLYTPIAPIVFNYYDAPSVYSIVTIRLAPGDVVHTTGQIRKTLEKIVPGQSVQIRFYDAELQKSYQQDRALRNTMAFFSLLAALITLAGLVGFTLNMINARTKELAIRKVNGATEKELILLLNKVFLWNILLALALFLPLSYQVIRLWLQQYAYSVPLRYGWFALAALGVSAVVLGVVSFFTIRAARSNPVESLRYE
jgi:putative ABC transport system permease protein